MTMDLFKKKIPFLEGQIKSADFSIIWLKKPIRNIFLSNAVSKCGMKILF